MSRGINTTPTPWPCFTLSVPFGELSESEADPGSTSQVLPNSLFWELHKNLLQRLERQHHTLPQAYRTVNNEMLLGCKDQSLRGKKEGGFSLSWRGVVCAASDKVGNEGGNYLLTMGPENRP